VPNITIIDADIGTTIVTGDGSLTELALIGAGQSEPWSLLALVDGRGFALYLSDALGIIPVDNEIWGKPLLSFAVPFVGGLIREERAEGIELAGHGDALVGRVLINARAKVRFRG
jgi:hypothetical protein